MTALDRVAAAAARLKVFPLPDAVLFPHAALPLHIFEPRYRALVTDCLAGDKAMGLVQLGPDWDLDYQGRPAVREVLCAGVVVWSEALADGRFNILLQGIARARVVRGLPPTRSYREFQVELLAEADYHGPEEQALQQAVLELSSRAPSGAAEGLLQVTAKLGGGALADVVANSLIEDPHKRQELLEELDPQRRLAAVLEEVSDLLGRLPAMGRSGPLN